MASSSKQRDTADAPLENLTRLLSALSTFQSTRGDSGKTDDDLPSKLGPSLVALQKRREVAQVPHTSFWEVNQSTLTEVDVWTGPTYQAYKKINTEAIKDLGKEQGPNGFGSFDVIIKLIQSVRKHISPISGSRSMISIILLHLASNVQSETREIYIIPDFPIMKTILETASGGRSFSGMIDYVLVAGPPQLSEFVMNNPIDVLANRNAFHCLEPIIVIEATKDDLLSTVPKAAIAGATYCRQHKTRGPLRGCITSGEQWAFTYFMEHESGVGDIHVAEEITLGTDLEELPLILGLLSNLILPQASKSSAEH